MKPSVCFLIACATLCSALTHGSAEQTERAIQKLQSESRETRSEGMKELSSSREPLADIILRLKDIAKKEKRIDVQLDIIDVACPLGNQSLDLIMIFLNSSDAVVQIVVVNCLAEMVRRSDELLPALVSLLEHQSSAVRGAAVGALGSLGRPAGVAFDKMVMLLSDKDPTVRAQAIFGLAGVAPDDPEVMTYVQDALQDHDSHVREMAVYVIGSMNLDYPSTVSILDRIAQSDMSPAVRDAAKEVLDKIQKTGK